MPGEGGGRIVGGCGYENVNAPHPLQLLRAGRKRPGCDPPPINVMTSRRFTRTPMGGITKNGFFALCLGGVVVAATSGALYASLLAKLDFAVQKPRIRANSASSIFDKLPS